MGPWLSGSLLSWTSATCDAAESKGAASCLSRPPATGLHGLKISGAGIDLSSDQLYPELMYGDQDTGGRS